MRSHSWADIAAAIFVLAGLYILVKPDSKAPAFVANTGAALDSIVSFAVVG